MTDLAKLIRVRPSKGLEVDGQEFPWYITEDGASIQVSGRNRTTVTVTLLCERVEIVDERGAE